MESYYVTRSGVQTYYDTDLQFRTGWHVISTEDEEISAFIFKQCPDIWDDVQGDNMT